ncbi:MAG: efflux RND transporter periplasmic adaptor subunit, partial [Bacteroidales bacterium]|nr:efflux RND transporter periplasmic adaptor subunit [Bacteroidales bacterium]
MMQLRIITGKKNLYDKEIISQSELQRVSKTFNAAKEELVNAENNLQLIRDGAIKSVSNTSNTLIRATVSGMVLDVPIRKGANVIQTNTFNDGTTIAIIADMDDMIFKGKVDETEIGKIYPGMHIEINIGALEGKLFNATLTYISPKGINENGSVLFEIMADMLMPSNHSIKAGLSANADIILEQADSVLVIEENLVHFRNDTAYVEVLTTEQPIQLYKEKMIKLGISDGMIVQVIEGITLNDQLKGNKIYDQNN